MRPRKKSKTLGADGSSLIGSHPSELEVRSRRRSSWQHFDLWYFFYCSSLTLRYEKERAFHSWVWCVGDTGGPVMGFVLQPHWRSMQGWLFFFFFFCLRQITAQTKNNSSSLNPFFCNRCQERWLFWDEYHDINHPAVVGKCVSVRETFKCNLLSLQNRWALIWRERSHSFITTHTCRWN